MKHPGKVTKEFREYVEGIAKRYNVDSYRRWRHEADVSNWFLVKGSNTLNVNFEDCAKDDGLFDMNEINLYLENYFENPLEPTPIELTLFELEFGEPYILESFDKEGS